jgi:hypothetical protein
MTSKTKEQDHAEAEAAAAAAGKAGDTKGDTGKADAAKSEAPRGESDVRGLKGSSEKDDPANASHVTGRKSDDPVIETRAGVTLNDPARDAQIRKADEAMKKKTDDSTPGATALAKRHEAEEEKYANHADLPPATGKAWNTNTPTIAEDGTKHWGA